MHKEQTLFMRPARAGRRKGNISKGNYPHGAHYKPLIWSQVTWRPWFPKLLQVVDQDIVRRNVCNILGVGMD